MFNFIGGRGAYTHIHAIIKTSKSFIFNIMDFRSITILPFFRVFYFPSKSRNGETEGVNITGVLCINKSLNVSVGPSARAGFRVHAQLSWILKGPKKQDFLSVG